MLMKTVDIPQDVKRYSVLAKESYDILKTEAFLKSKVRHEDFIKQVRLGNTVMRWNLYLDLAALEEVRQHDAIRCVSIVDKIVSF